MKNYMNNLPFGTLLLSAMIFFQSIALAQEKDIYMGAPVELANAPNGAIANKKVLDRVEGNACPTPQILEPAEGIWTFCGFTLAPISVLNSVLRWS